MARVREAGDHSEIALRHRDTLQSFNQLFRSRNSKDDSVSPAVREQFARFKVWAENVGAHRTGRVSLDHRLREAADVKEMVIELLIDLNEALRDGIAAVPLHVS